MKKIISIVLLIGILYSCTGVEYKSPQPLNGKNLTEFPKKIRGTFQVRLMGDEPDSGFDTLTIFSDYYEDGKTNNKKFYLSDSLIFRAYKGNYYLSAKDGKDKYWTVGQIVIESDDKFMVNAVYDTGDDEDLFVENVNNISAITVIKNKDSREKYVINPSPKELEKLAKKDFFKPVYEFTRIKK